MSIIEKINKHGIKITEYRTSHWGHHDKEGKWHNGVFQIPECCFNCKNLDSGETDEYGSVWNPPSCNLNIWMPTKTGKCSKRGLRYVE